MKRLLIEKRKLTILEIDYLISNYKTKYKIGFTNKEISKILLKLEISPSVYNDNFGINTCAAIDGQYVFYHSDVFRTIINIWKKQT
jgi:hypothetical protein